MGVNRHHNHKVQVYSYRRTTVCTDQSMVFYNLFGEKCIHDNDWEFLGELTRMGYRVSYIPIKVTFHLQGAVLILGQLLLLNLLSVAMWYGVILPLQHKDRSTALLVGLGMLLPISFALPQIAIETLDIQNKGLRFTLILIPMTVPFKLFELLFGSDSPERRARCQSLQVYRKHAGFIFFPKLDKDHSLVPLSISHFLKVAQDLLVWMVIFFSFTAIMFTVDWRPFPEHPSEQHWWPSFDPGRLYNTFLQTLCMAFGLIYVMKAIAKVCMLIARVNYQDDLLDGQPMLLSQSPSDFWGRRWNKLIHRHLKEGVYQPIRKRFGRHLGTVATFVVSGMAHEFVQYLIFLRTPQERTLRGACTTCYDPAVGKHFVFFAWNGMLIVLEHSALGIAIGGMVNKLRLPRLLQSHLVVLLALPVGHLFLEDLVQGGYFRHVAVGIPRLVFEKI